MSRLRFVVLAASLSTVSVAAACGGSSSTASAPPEPTGVIDPDAGPVGPDPNADSGVLPPDPLDPNYPTGHTAIPLVDYNGGVVLEAAKIVTVTFDGDAKRTMLESFGDVITTTKWWDAVRDGYCDSANHCVGQGSGGGHVHLGTAPALSYTDTAGGSGASTIKDMIRGYVADGTFPAPDVNTLYALYFPSGISITLDGQSSCSSFLAYHNSVSLTPPAVDGGAAPAAVDVAFAIMPRCSGGDAELTVSASHEFIEAATDPQTSSPAYYMRNQQWATLGGEVGDLCVGYQGGDTYLESGYTVQRSWSNKAAAASHDPCVPTPATPPYFNVAPNAGDVISLKVGATKTISLTAFSDAAMSDWALTTQEFTRFQGGNNVLTLTVDRPTVHNGSKINLTVTADARPSAGTAIFALTSKSGSTTHNWPIAVIVN